MNRPIIKDTEELKHLCKPLVEYLRKNCDPYTEVHITDSEIKVATVDCGIPLNDTRALEESTPQSFLPVDSDGVRYSHLSISTGPFQASHSQNPLFRK